MELNLCMGCMREKKQDGPCPYCGFDEQAYVPSPHHLPLQTILAGKYLVGRVLGEGGFGITYLGWDLNLEMKVAIKECFPNGFVTRDCRYTNAITMMTGGRAEFYQKSLDKFVDEARRLGKFWRLPGIVAVRDYFQENKTAYIVMEFVEGETLKAILKRGGSLPAKTIFEMLRPVMESLEEIHAAGLIHRDISPDNLMVDKKGNIKLLDFGAARDFMTDGERSLSVMLKPGYAPEEQYRSRGYQGPWTDVYALCATMYRAITGQVPPESLDRMNEDILKRPLELGITIESAQEAALLKGMAVLARNRYQSMGELSEALFNTETMNQDEDKKQKETEKGQGRESKQETAKGQEESKQETVKGQEESKQETVKGQEESKQETVKGQEENKQETVKEQEENKQETVKEQEESREENKKKAEKQEEGSHSGGEKEKDANESKNSEEAVHNSAAASSAAQKAGGIAHWDFEKIYKFSVGAAVFNMVAMLFLIFVIRPELYLDEVYSSIELIVIFLYGLTFLAPVINIKKKHNTDSHWEKTFWNLEMAASAVLTVACWNIPKANIYARAMFTQGTSSDMNTLTWSWRLGIIALCVLILCCCFGREQIKDIVRFYKTGAVVSAVILGGGMLLYLFLMTPYFTYGGEPYTKGIYIGMEVVIIRAVVLLHMFCSFAVYLYGAGEKSKKV